VCRLRGTGGDLIILEEAAFIPQDVWLEVVIPLIEVRNTALVAISTPLDSSNYYSTLIAMKDEDGKDVFDVLQAQAACAACVEQLDDPSKCPHVQLERPSWKSKEKQQVVKAMYEGNQQTLMRESMGIVTETSGGVFLKQCVKHLFSKPRVQFSAGVRHIYVAIDPCGGGESKFAMCSVYKENGSMVVVGLDDAKITGHTDMKDTILRHMHGLRRLANASSHTVKFIIMTESNLGLEAAHVANMLKDFPNCTNLRETGPAGRYGVLTTHQRKIEFVALIESMMSQQAIMIATDLISSDATAAIATLQRQLNQYRMVTSKASGVFSAAKISYSGKVDAQGRVGLMQDDLCIALQLAAYWSSYVTQRKCKFLDYDDVFGV
jgi:hypothetical protein